MRPRRNMSRLPLLLAEFRVSNYRPIPAVAKSRYAYTARLAKPEMTALAAILVVSRSTRKVRKPPEASSCGRGAGEEAVPKAGSILGHTSSSWATAASSLELFFDEREEGFSLSREFHLTFRYTRRGAHNRVTIGAVFSATNMQNWICKYSPSYP